MMDLLISLNITLTDGPLSAIQILRKHWQAQPGPLAATGRPPPVTGEACQGTHSTSQHRVTLAILETAGVKVGHAELCQDK